MEILGLSSVVFDNGYFFIELKEIIERVWYSSRLLWDLNISIDISTIFILFSVY